MQIGASSSRRSSSPVGSSRLSSSIAIWGCSFSQLFEVSVPSWPSMYLPRHQTGGARGPARGRWSAIRKTLQRGCTALTDSHLLRVLSLRMRQRGLTARDDGLHVLGPEIG